MISNFLGYFVRLKPSMISLKEFRKIFLKALINNKELMANLFIKSFPSTRNRHCPFKITNQHTDVSLTGNVVVDDHDMCDSASIGVRQITISALHTRTIKQ
jgi:hypothetical protein